MYDEEFKKSDQVSEILRDQSHMCIIIRALIYKARGGVSTNFIHDLLTDDAWDYLKTMYKKDFKEVVCAGQAKDEDHQICAANREGM